MTRSLTRRPKATDADPTNPAPSACDIALEGVIILLARHISHEMTSVDQPDDTRGGSNGKFVKAVEGS